MNVLKKINIQLWVAGWVESTAYKRPLLNSSYFSQTFDIPAHPRLHNAYQK